MADPGMRAGFIRAICAAPADDLPRLVFADWLEENDEPKRSEYIRLRCAVSNAAGLCRLPPKAASGRARKVRAPQAWCRCQVCRQVRRAADLFSR